MRANPLLETLTAPATATRERPFRALCQGLPPAELTRCLEELETFRRSAENLYQRVRASLFLYGGYRFFLQEHPAVPARGFIPPGGFAHLLARRYEQALASFRGALRKDGPNAALLSVLAETYHQLAFQTLSDQVRRSVMASRGNQWMFRGGHFSEHPVRLHPALIRRTPGSLLSPVLAETTPVRLDLSHSGWSDIFFLAMDDPEGARVLNISVDLGVYGRDRAPRPPIETFVRAIPESCLRLTSVDLESTKEVTDLRELFNFGNDYLGLLKAGVVASGVIPPSFEGSEQPLARILDRVVGPGMGLEIVTYVHEIPKGSRLAVSTNLLASLVSVLMRATGQTAALEGPLAEDERRVVASRAILGEWLAGSGGGWQDSGGLWPGAKLIQGALAAPSDPEWGLSRGCLLPNHHVLAAAEFPPDARAQLNEALLLIHGGMAQNVGPILELVTEKYLLRSAAEWQARHELHGIFDDLRAALKAGDVRGLARCTSRNWDGPLKAIIPWVTNHFTESLLTAVKARLGADYWGFLMLGGLSGGGMALFAAPPRARAFRDELLELMRRTKRALEDALPFAMDPVIYDFRVNETGTTAALRRGAEAVMPWRYYALHVPELVQNAAAASSYLRRAEFDHFVSSTQGPEEVLALLRTMVTNLFRVANPASQQERLGWDADAEKLMQRYGFDAVQHERLRADLRAGRIGLARNRLPADTAVEDVQPEDVVSAAALEGERARGEAALRAGQVAVLSLAGGVGSRWTLGAGVVKAVQPFVWLGGRHRSFLEIHLAQTRRLARQWGTTVPHVVATSFLTHPAIEKHLALNGNYGHAGPLYLSPGRSLALRLVPMVRDLAFLWEQLPQEVLDERKQKKREDTRKALMAWAQAQGEGGDYTDNVAAQRFNPPGHWYEVPNLLRNGVLARLLREQPQVTTIFLRNIDTLGAGPDPAILGYHLGAGRTLTYEVVPRRFGDVGGGLARVNGRVRLLEGLAQPRDEDELRLSYYNTMSTWIQVELFLAAFGLTRADLAGPDEKLAEAVRRMALRVPTYVTIKDVKRRWGHGQEDIFPVAQFEKLWSDMTSLPELPCGYVAVSRLRGQQLKTPNQLDPWVEDGSRDFVEGLCAFE